MTNPFSSDSSVGLDGKGPAPPAQAVHLPSATVERPNLALIGFSTTGKSTVARLLADQLGCYSADTDQLIVATTGRPHASASSTTLGSPSRCDGSTSTSAARR